MAPDRPHTVKILSRYVLREHAGPLVFALAALTAVLLLNQLAKQFGSLVGKGLPWAVIAEVFALSVPFIAALSVPMAVLVAVLYAFSRMAAENEITALRASGVSIGRLVRPVLGGATALAAFMLLFHDQILPRTNHKLQQLQTDIFRKKPTFALREQVINEVSRGELYLRAGKIVQGTGRMREVTIFDLSSPSQRITMHADSGEMRLSPDQSDLLLTLYDGYSQQTSADKPGEVQRLYFRSDVFRVKGVANRLERTEDTYKSDREMTVCEMQAQAHSGAATEAMARQNLGERLAAVVHRAATGEDEPAKVVGEEDAVVRRHTLGSLYCETIPRLLRLASADTQPSVVPLTGPHTDDARARARALAEKARAGGDTTPRTDVRVRDTAARDITSHGDSAQVAIIPPGGGAPGTGTPGALRPAAEPRAPRPTPVSALVAVVAAEGDIDVYRARLKQARETVAAYEVEINKKFALSAACIVFALLGAPIALRFPRGGVGLVIGVSLGVFALYYVGLIGGETLANSLIVSPFWSMWLANLVFTAVGLYFLARMRRVETSSRGGDASEMLDAARAWARRQGARVGLVRRRRDATT